MVITVIEEASAVERIDEIAATPGIDVLFIGTSDLSFSLGLRGQQNEPTLQAAIDKVAAAAKKHGKFLGRPAGSAVQGRLYLLRTGLPVIPVHYRTGTAGDGRTADPGTARNCCRAQE